MINFLSVPLITRAWAILLAMSSGNTYPYCSKAIFRVCHSPGCRDDGAIATMDKLNALAPPGVQVVKGGCVSLCGSGPVVEICSDGGEMTISSVKRKRVKGDALLSLLNEFTVNSEAEGGLKQQTPAFTRYMRDRLIEGYEQSLEANNAYNRKNYEKAVELYQDAIENGRKPALILQEIRDARGNESGSEMQQYGYPAGLRWLVESFRNSCRSKLALGDVDGARRDAFAATVFSKNADASAHECLAEVCAKSGDALGELQALKAAISSLELLEEEYLKPLPGKDAVARAAAAIIRNDAAARKRELGFKAVKLESILGLS
mmetsp:Transcript_13469/g.27286  ORF Transcript_13469/g.27286 Transcript_13469/m.27286 type:complete len:319 (-) Transcript_13469:2002-2958(-)